MERSLSSSGSSDRAAPVWVVALVGAAGALVGLVSERAAYDWSEVRLWVPDLAVGLAVLGAGLYSMPRQRPTGLLLVASAFAWFLGNVSGSLAFLARGPLVHLVVAYPTGRPRRRIDLAAVVIGYVSCLTGAIWGNDVRAVAGALAVLGVVASGVHTTTGKARRDQLTGVAMATAGASALIIVAVLGETLFGANDVRQYVYGLGITGIAVIAAAGVRRHVAADVTDLVVELGEGSSGALQDALGTALGDPTLVIGYPSGDGEFGDEVGRRVLIPAPGERRTATYVTRADHPIAVLVHDASLPSATTLMGAITTMTELAAANSSLLDDVRRQVDELGASRRRLLVTADDERRRLDLRLQRGAEHRVDTLQQRLSAHLATSDLPPDEHLARAADQLALTLDDLRHLAQGLRPRELDEGLHAALAALAERCPAPVCLRYQHRGTVPDEVALAVYFVVAEALTNVVKHAGARSAELLVDGIGGELVVVVDDDGAGGADTVVGTGLRGLGDRVDALGGTLELTSNAGLGTRLRVAIPVGTGVG